MLTGAVGAMGATLLPQAAPERPQVPDDPTKVLGNVVSARSERSPFEQPARHVPQQPQHSSASWTPLEDLHGIITPSDLHFERHHAGIPAIDPERYQLLIHGLVERPMVFSLADLQRLPAVSRLNMIECSGNGGTAYHPDEPPPDRKPGQIDGLTSTSEWTGVPLSLLFREVGVLPEATWFVAEGQDAAVMARSIPIEKAWEDAMIAYGQNGEALRPAQGYPARLVLPGWEGNTQIKWLRRIELTDQPAMTREETSHYTDPLPDGTARQFSFVMDAKSIITSPAYPDVLSEPGWWEIRGLAWSGRGMIERVEVSTDAGATWHLAELQGPVLPKCHTRFRHLWQWDGNPATLMSRATDETGYTQPTREVLRTVRGPGTSYHYNNIRAWHVGANGRVFFGVERRA
ncbi:MAG: sulfite dehydrogenase [Rhodothermales bacterium]